MGGESLYENALQSNNASVNSSIAHPPPRATPGHLHFYFARGSGIGTCKVVPGAGNCLPAGHLTRPDVSPTNTCYYIKMASKNSRVKTRILSIFSFTKRHTNRT
jgi:hypothetical protein